MHFVHFCTTLSLLYFFVTVFFLIPSYVITCVTCCWGVVLFFAPSSGCCQSDFCGQPSNMDVDDLCDNCSWPYGFTYAKFYDKDDLAIYVFRQHGVLPSVVQCPHCGNDCKLHSYASSTSKVSLRWRCQKTYECPVGSGKRKLCNYYISDRKGTFLEKCHHPP